MPRAPSPATTLLPVLLLLLSSSKLLLMAGSNTSSSHSSSFVSTKTNHHNQHSKRSSPTFISDPPFSEEEKDLHTINPWLSATDVRAASAVSCPRSSSVYLCPPPCVSPSSLSHPNNNNANNNKKVDNSNNNNSTQCLDYLQELHIEEVCGSKKYPDSNSRRAKLRGLRMRHCCEHAVDSALPEAAFDGGSVCKQHLDALLQVDQIASRLSCNQADLLIRYDCSQNFSIAHDCKDCKQAYRRWVCSSLVPHYTRYGERVRPCLSVCEDVEQQCPYLLPDQTILPGEAAHPTPQYAGEPTFLCLDPNIPETGQQRRRSTTGDENCCYTHCGSPGRGTGDNQQSPNKPDSDQGARNYILGICEHCPGRPPNNDGAAISRASRTINQVFPLWTSLFVIILHMLQTTENVIKAFLLRCLLYSVRTVNRQFFKNRTHS